MSSAESLKRSRDLQHVVGHNQSPQDAVWLTIQQRPVRDCASEEPRKVIVLQGRAPLSCLQLLGVGDVLRPVVVEVEAGVLRPRDAVGHLLQPVKLFRRGEHRSPEMCRLGEARGDGRGVEGSTKRLGVEPKLAIVSELVKNAIVVARAQGGRAEVDESSLDSGFGLDEEAPLGLGLARSADVAFRRAGEGRGRPREQEGTRVALSAEDGLLHGRCFQRGDGLDAYVWERGARAITEAVEAGSEDVSPSEAVQGLVRARPACQDADDMAPVRDAI
mmetsp:Transcript_22063/g.68998  ORF Transcript_22063/g.68998 Transcript_22063/m.68998 type:complete len:275 (-) Transcript_22063:1046-1870(-)